MSTPLLLTFNPGSSTIKIGLFSVTAGEATRIGQGMIDFRHAAAAAASHQWRQNRRDSA